MLELDFSSFPERESSRLWLRELKVSDAAEIHNIRGDVNAMRYIGRPISQSVDDAVALIQKIKEDCDTANGITWGLRLKENNLLIGTVGFYRLKKEHYRSELGYIMSPAYWGMGLMSEAIQLVLEIGFNEFGFHSIEACVNPENTNSIKILQRNGFKQEGLFRECFYFAEQFYDSAVFTLLAKDFNAR